MTEFEIAIAILSLLIIIILLPSLLLVKADEQVLIERLGKYHKIINDPGIYFMIPFIDRVITKVSSQPYFVSMKRKTKHTIHTYKIEVFDLMLYTYQTLDPIKEIHHFISLTLDEGKSLSEIEFMLEGYTQQFGINISSIVVDNF